MISITSIKDRSSVFYGEIGANIMAAAYGGSDRDRLMVRIYKLIFIVYFIYITIVFEIKMMK
jgi:hypothetical protein